jgi:hypothetical protein
MLLPVVDDTASHWLLVKDIQIWPAPLLVVEFLDVLRDRSPVLHFIWLRNACDEPGRILCRELRIKRFQASLLRIIYRQFNMLSAS